ncbi:hypothetical protein [Sphingobium indicum]|uniref:Uncharacterized protein n=1 Tax=Sphingobium indicum (strain DSM 16412 / CCM 7286 / MTCC 6364 / B90A) TaxID=861109 RepID=A0A1L5BTF3_SPHIB|nr:hypothetical protein SIDU_17330 [Sphingobium indicum B90A]
MQQSQFDYARHPVDRLDGAVRRVGDGVVALKLVGEFVDRLVGRIVEIRPLLHAERVHDPGGKACRQRMRLMLEPLERTVPDTRRHEDGELAMPLGERGAEAQQFAEPLPFVGKFGIVQRCAERADQPSARAAHDRFIHRALGGIHGREFRKRNARHYALHSG